ncbi:hypothetical protein FOMPIDRAFT_1048346 [Fomitopsis schrenkii]|uniref:Uncharacterized protein n=1 Tax=Fomitopsis schrenkii TaxID=2126942 RepID=S8EF00_FOMSC|nr:hypothetical protein FOMPIDRAFT_1048346 [Fomitopsis schrenkii]
MLCTSCCKKRHKHDYLHRVERWSCAIASPNVALGGEEEDGEPDSEDWVPEELASEPIASEPIASVHGYYETSSLFEVGVKLHLGHGGLPCPSDMFTKLEKI